MTQPDTYWDAETYDRIGTPMRAGWRDVRAYVADYLRLDLWAERPA